MHFLFISSILGPTIGGIETLIARMSKWLLDKGHKVTLLANRTSEFHDIFPHGMQIFEIGDALRQFRFYCIAKREWPKLLIERPDVIKSFHLIDSWISYILSNIIKPTPKVLFGNYFPYIFPQSRNPLKYFAVRPYLLNLQFNFPDNAILCMDEEQINQFRKYFGHHRNPHLWLLPVNDPSIKNITQRTPQWGKIISVSRLEPMKEYNFHMIDVIAKLRQKGFPVTWFVYGEGCFRDAMQVKINALGLNEVIHLKGKLSYSQFADAMKDAYLFVGMGTSIIEAALCGVPGVMALAHDTSGSTYGSLYHFPIGNLGIRTDTPASTSLEVEIERVLTLSKHEYEIEIKKNRKYAENYLIDRSMDRFLKIVSNTSPLKKSRWLLYYYYAHGIIEIVLKLLKKSNVKSKRC